jgi:hypothetical protein
MRLISFMAAQADHLGRPKYTRTQIAASLLHPVAQHVVRQYLPRRGRGGDPRELPPPAIARLRALRAERHPDGGHAYTLSQLAGMFDVHPASIERHCVDLSFPDLAGSGDTPHTASSGGVGLNPAMARRAEAMYAERDGNGHRLHTPDQVAAEFGVSVSDLKRALRARRGVRNPGQSSSTAAAGTPSAGRPR